MSYFIISRGDWSIPAQEFVQHLRSQWPSAVTREDTDPESSDSFEFTLGMPHSEVEGALNRSGKSLYFDSDIRDAAEFALWFRSLAPPEEPLVLCDEAMSALLELEPGTNETDIFRAFDYTPAPPGWRNYELIPRGDWGVPVHFLAQQMRTRWPAAQLVQSEEPESGWSFEFRVPMPHSQVSGNIRRKVHAMTFTGDPRDCAEFALGCRTLIPVKELLLMYDQGYLRLTKETTTDDILGIMQK
jgi:hypothetical protein